MGVLNDYFRAPDDEAASAVGRRIGGPLVRGNAGEPALDGTDAKGIDAPVVLGKLIALRRDDAWHVDIIDSTTVYPAGPRLDAATFASLPDDSPWMNGPWIARLGDAARDDLASIDAGEVGELASRWATIEEFHDPAVGGALAGILTELVGLARRARADGEHLYCWTSL